MAAGAVAAAPSRNWAYQARDGAGKLVKGKIEAPTESAAIDRMRTLGLSPVKVSESVAGTGLNREIEIGGGKRVGLKDLAVLSRQAATMVAAGLSLLKTLSILAEQTENKKLKTTLSSVARDVEVGFALSDALGKHPRSAVLQSDLASEGRKLNAGPFRGAEQAVRALHRLHGGLVPFRQPVA